MDQQSPLQQASFGEILRQYRVAAGLSQEALAECARLSVRGISDLERGINRTPRRETVALLAEALRLTEPERASLEASIVRRRGPPRDPPLSPRDSFPATAPAAATVNPDANTPASSTALVVPVLQGQAIRSEGVVASHRANYRKLRRFGAFGLLLVVSASILLVALSERTGRAAVTPAPRLVILVADFSGPAPQKYRVTDFVLSQLYAATKAYPDVRIRALGTAITEQQGGDIAAAQVATVNHAGIILWGWYAKTATSVYLTAHLQQLSGPRATSATEYASTLKTGEAALESFQVQTTLSTNVRYLTLLMLGLIRFDAHDYQGAIARWSAALALRGQVAGEHLDAEPTALPFNLGVAYLVTGNNRAAEQQLTTALALDAHDGRAYQDRGVVRLHLADDAGAIADFTQAIRLLPGAARAYYDRGVAHLRLRQWVAAASDFAAALRLQPTLASARVDLARARSHLPARQVSRRSSQPPVAPPSTRRGPLNRRRYRA